MAKFWQWLLVKVLRHRPEAGYIPYGPSWQWCRGPHLHFRTPRHKLRVGLWDWRPFCWYTHVRTP